MRQLFKTMLLVAGFAATLLSCGKAPVDGPAMQGGGDPADESRGTMAITLGGAAIQTKMTGIYDANESRVDHWSYWVFNDENWAIKCGEGSSSLHEEVTLLTGDYTIVILANYPTSGIWAVPLRAGITKSTLLSRVSDLSSNTYNCFLMEGEKSVTIEADEVTPIEIKIARMVSKVGVRKISVNYTKPSLAAKTTTLRGIYLTNLYRTTRYGTDYADTELDATRSKWYNSMGWHRWDSEQVSGEIDALVGDRGLSINISSSAPHEQAHYFYCYPNPSKKENDTHDISAWSVRSSRLIIETEVDGKAYYYQVQLPPMRRNTPYVAAEVIIRDLGSMDPEDIIPGSLDVTFSTSTDGWEGNYSVTEES